MSYPQNDGRGIFFPPGHSQQGVSRGMGFQGGNNGPQGFNPSGNTGLGPSTGMPYGQQLGGNINSLGGTGIGMGMSGQGMGGNGNFGRGIGGMNNPGSAMNSYPAPGGMGNPTPGIGGNGNFGRGIGGMNNPGIGGMYNQSGGYGMNNPNPGVIGVNNPNPGIGGMYNQSGGYGMNNPNPGVIGANNPNPGIGGMYNQSGGYGMNNPSPMIGQNPGFQGYNTPANTFPTTAGNQGPGGYSTPNAGYSNMNYNNQNQGFNPNKQSKIVWKWECEDGMKKPYDDAISNHIELCYQKSQFCQFSLPTDKGLKNYKVDFQAMKQINSETGFLKTIYREPI